MAGRVQINDLPSPQDLRPAQTAGDTFGGAPKPVQDDNFSRLSQALGIAATTATKAAEAVARKENKTFAQDAYVRLSTLGPQELEQRFKDGTLPNLNNPSVAPIYGAQLGKNVAIRLSEGNTAAIKAGAVPAFDDAGNPTNMWEPLAKATEDYFKANPNHARQPGFAEAFWTEMEKGRKIGSDLQQTKRVEHVKAYIQDGLSNGMNALIVRAEGQDQSDEAVRNVWKGFREDLRARGTKAGIDIPWRELDDAMVGRLRENVKAHPEAVLRVLSLDRGMAEDGTTKLGALKDMPGRMDDINSIRETARGELETRTDLREKETAIAAASQALQRGDLSFNGLQNYNYKNPWSAAGRSPDRVINAEEIRKEAEVRYMSGARDNWQRQGVSKDVGEAAALEAENRMYVANNRPNPRWNSLLNDAVTIYGNPSAVSDDTKLGPLVEARKTYEYLRVHSPGYLESTLKVSDRDKTFYQMVNVYQNIRGLPEKEAFSRASNFILHPPEAISGAALRSLRDAADGLDLSWVPFSGTANVAHSQVRRDIISVAKSIAADRDIPVDKALEFAHKEIKSRTVLLNGTMITGNGDVSPQNSPAWQTRLEEIAKSHGGVMVSASGVGGFNRGSQLSIRPMDGSRDFMVIDSSTGEPMVVPRVGPDGKQMSPEVLKIHPEEIRVIERDLREATLAEVSRKAARAPDENVMRQGMYDVTPKSQVPGNTPAEKQKNAIADLKRRQEEAQARLKSLPVAPEPSGGPVPTQAKQLANEDKQRKAVMDELARQRK